VHTETVRMRLMRPSLQKWQSQNLIISKTISVAAAVSAKENSTSETRMQTWSKKCSSRNRADFFILAHNIAHIAAVHTHLANLLATHSLAKS